MAQVAPICCSDNLVISDHPVCNNKYVFLSGLLKNFLVVKLLQVGFVLRQCPELIYLNRGSGYILAYSTVSVSHTYQGLSLSMKRSSLQLSKFISVALYLNNKKAEVKEISSCAQEADCSIVSHYKLGKQALCKVCGNSIK